MHQVVDRRRGGDDWPAKRVVCSHCGAQIYTHCNTDMKSSSSRWDKAISCSMDCAIALAEKADEDV